MEFGEDPFLHKRINGLRRPVSSPPDNDPWVPVVLARRPAGIVVQRSGDPLALHDVDVLVDAPGLPDLLDPNEHFPYIMAQ